ncbi:MBL fold metallo-hydrolase [Corallococcus exercitus]|uniref:MBL fold metallo-hydrolase n=1 Tax=Corallococcus exercitus TaxID=2316736 RepID=UPI001ABEF3EE|nr:MBL fold metallo-hydrolase [Corallococcus exercitus]
MLPSSSFLVRNLAMGALLMGAPLLAVNDAHAAPPPQVRGSSPGYYRMMLGDFEVTALSDGTVTLPMDKLLTNITAAQLKTQLARTGLDPSHVEGSINAYLIHTGEHLVLVDAGAGKALDPNASGRLLNSLRAAGYRPEDIDAVLLTHVHVDHHSGLTVDGKAVFPNAVVYVEKNEADFWLDASNEKTVAEELRAGFAQAAASFAPYLAANKVKKFTGSTELFPGVRSISVPGHSPGHSFYAIESKGQQMQFWGDLVHVKDVQFRSPGVTIKFDLDAAAAARQRLKAMNDAAAKGYYVGAAHISFPGIGRVLADGKAFTWLPVNYSVAGLKP